MKNKQYWAKRFNGQYNGQAARGARSAKRLADVYNKAAANIEKELDAWYARFAGDNGISMQEARKLLTNKELKAFQMDVGEYIARGRSVSGMPDGPQKEALIKELENVSAKVHVSRLEAMQLRMKYEAQMAGGAANAEITRMAADVYSDAYYHTAFEVQRGTGVGFEFAQLDNAKVKKIIDTPWAADGKNFSERVWGNTAQLVNELEGTFTLGIIQGKSLRDMSKALSERMGVAQSKAARLVTTENAYFTSAAQRDSFKALGVEYYEIVATLDSHTSAVCQGLDGKKIAVKDLQPGSTAPPFHPNCRCTTVPYFDDEFTEGEKRAARFGDDTGYVEVPSEMTYPEWEKRFLKAPATADENDLKIPCRDGKIVIKAEDYANHNFAFPGEDLYVAFNNVKPIAGYSDFKIHGRSDYVAVKNTDGKWARWFKPGEFSKYILKAPNYDGGPIRLLSCSAGAGDNSFAQQLSNLLGVDIMAPTETLHVAEDGRMFVSNVEWSPAANNLINRFNRGDATAEEQTGSWVIFKPNRGGKNK